MVVTIVMSVKSPAPPDGRSARRIESMRRVQAAALDLAEARGLDHVSVEEIAAAAGVGPATVYRNFATKERIVLWDEYDPPLLTAIAECLAEAQPPLRATCNGVATALEHVYREDRARILRRARLVLSDPKLDASAETDRAALRAALAALFIAKNAASSLLDADVLAAAGVAALQVAVTHWTRAAGRKPLRTFVHAAFAALHPPR